MKHKWNKKENKQDYDICLQCGIKKIAISNMFWMYTHKKNWEFPLKFTTKAGICPNNLK